MKTRMNEEAAKRACAVGKRVRERRVSLVTCCTHCGLELRNNISVPHSALKYLNARERGKVERSVRGKTGDQLL